MKNYDLTVRSISFFMHPVASIKPTSNMSLTEVYELIVGEKYQQVTDALRSESNPKRRREMKASKLDCITPSGIFYTRSDDGLKYHSEILCIDVDDLKDEAQQQDTKQTLIEDPNFYTLMLFRSPSGNGLKWFIPIDLKLCGHRKWFEAVRNYLYQTYSIIADEKCINTSRSCFLCHDPEAYACQNIINNIKLD